MTENICRNEEKVHNCSDPHIPECMIPYKVDTKVDLWGIQIPVSVHWKDGNIWKIDRVLHVCLSTVPKLPGLRYTVLIQNNEYFLYSAYKGILWYLIV